MAENHDRLLKKVKNLINCSHLGMLCMKGCPRAQETERPVLKDGDLSNDMALLSGRVLYEVTDTRKKSMFKYDRELAKLMVPIRRSPSGPVLGTKSAQPPTKKNVQQPSPKPQASRKSGKSRRVRRGTTKSKKTEYVTPSSPNPILLLAAYSTIKKKIETPPTQTLSIPVAKSDSSGSTVPGSSKLCLTQPSTMLPLEVAFDMLPRRRTGWKYVGPGLHGGAPPKKSSQEAPPGIFNLIVTKELEHSSINILSSQNQHMISYVRIHK